MLRNAPPSSGIYGLFSALWIYIGEAQNIQGKLLEHLTETGSCISHYRPSSFAFELVEADERETRRAEISTMLQPLCQGRDFVYRSVR